MILGSVVCNKLLEKLFSVRYVYNLNHTNFVQFNVFTIFVNNKLSQKTLLCKTTLYILDVLSAVICHMLRAEVK